MTKGTEILMILRSIFSCGIYISQWYGDGRSGGLLNTGQMDLFWGGWVKE